MNNNIPSLVLDERSKRIISSYDISNVDLCEINILIIIAITSDHTNNEQYLIEPTITSMKRLIAIENKKNNQIDIIFTMTPSDQRCN